MSLNENQPNMQYPAEFFYQIILEQQYEQLDLSNRDTVKQFTSYVSALSLEVKNLIIIQKLAIYGLPVLIYFRNFYRQARKNECFMKEHKKKFNRISSIAKWATDNKNIEGIKFIHEVGASQRQYNKGMKKQQIDLKFIEFVIKLENKNEELRNKVEGGRGRLKRNQIQQLLAQYHQQIIKQIQGNQFDQLMLQSIQRFKVSNQQILNMLKVGQNHKSNTIVSEFKIQSDIDQQKDKLPQQQSHSMEAQISVSSQSGSQLNQSMDFYKLNNFLQSTVTQNQKTTQIQLQSKSYNIFVQGIQVSPFSRKDKHQTGTAQNQKNHILFKKYENQKYCDLTPNEKQQQKSTKSMKGMKSKQIEKGSQYKKNKNKYLCCRTYLYYEQKIDEIQNQTTSYIHASFPLKKEKNQEIKKIICSFLNSSGGTLYIGIVRENDDYIVVGNLFCQGQKQVILRTFRQICQNIEPDILTHKMYNVEFVPLKEMCSVTKSSSKYIPGNYVLKIAVRFGIRDQIYSYKSGCQDIFPFRQDRQIILKEGRQLLQELNLRINKPLKVPKPLHEHPCQKPDIGEVLNNYFQDIQYCHKKSQQLSLNNTEKKRKEREKQSYYNELKNESPVKQNKRQKFSPKKKTIVHFQADILKTPENLSKKQLKKMGSNKIENKKEDAQKNMIYRSEPVEKKKKIKEMEQSCFYISGLTKKQIMPVLQKKNLVQKVKMQESQYEETLGFIIKTHEAGIKEQIIRILQKIKEKYRERQISYDEITLEMQVQNLKSAILQLQNINISCFQVRSQSKKIIKFTYYKDSLKAFIYFRKHHFSVQYVLSS